MSLGDRIKSLRADKGIERAELAETLGITYHALSKYETNEREPDYETVKKLADFFGVTTDYLLGHNGVRLRIETHLDENNPDIEKSLWEINEALQRYVARGTITEEDVLKWAMVSLENPNMLLAHQKRMKRSNNQDFLNEKKTIETSLKAAQEERDRLIYLFQKGIVTEIDIEDKLADINGRLNILTARKREIERKETANDVSVDFIDDLQEIRANIGPAVDALPFEDKQRLLRMLNTKVVIHSKEKWDISIKGIRIGGQ